MDWNRVEGNWKQVKGKVKEQWGKLTDNDLDTIAGKQDQLEGKIQQRYGLANGWTLSLSGCSGRPWIRKATHRVNLQLGKLVAGKNTGENNW